MTTAKKKHEAKGSFESVLTVYVESLQPSKDRAQTASGEAQAMLTLITGYVIHTQEEYEQCAELVKEIQGKIKLLDEERKVTVTPLNDEVKRINDWYRPALDALKQVKDRGLKVMGEYVLEKKREEARLLQEAQEAAQKVLATAPDVRGGMEPAAALVAQAAATAPTKVQGVSDRPVWKWSVVDAEALVRAHPELAMPDPKKIAAWIAEHGDQNVPTGVEVVADVKFIVRGR